MPRAVSTEASLTSELESFQKYHHISHLELDQAFIVWFLYARFGYDASEAVKSLPARAQDNNVDAVYIDRAEKCVRIVQGKYRTSSAKRVEKQNDVLQFAAIASAIGGDDEAFDELLQGANDKVKGMLKEARRLVRIHDFALFLHYVTTAGCSDVVRDKALKAVKKNGGQIDIFAIEDVTVLLQKYLDGAPFLGSIDLFVDGDYLRQPDSQTNICSWIFSMSGTEVASMYTKFEDRLFALNVRAFQGESKLVNEGMSKTLREQPLFFWFFNNGITLLCDKAKIEVAGNGKTKLVVTNPQIINGQQTTVMLSKSKNAHMAKVAVRVIQIDSNNKTSEFEDLLTKIVKNTNSQTRVSPYQLVCNDRRQIALEREFERKNYLYVRKKQGSGANLSYVGSQRYKLKIDIVSLAKSVAACDLDPVYALRGADTLFQDYYEKIFPKKRDSTFYLPRYWLHDCVVQAINQLPESPKERMKPARWLITHILWQNYLGPFLSGAKRAEQFREFCEVRDSKERLLLERAIKSVARACDECLRELKATAATGDSTKPRDLLSHRGVANAMNLYWLNGRKHLHRKTFSTFWEKFQNSFEI